MAPQAGPPVQQPGMPVAPTAATTVRPLTVKQTVGDPVLLLSLRGAVLMKVPRLVAVTTTMTATTRMPPWMVDFAHPCRLQTCNRVSGGPLAYCYQS